MLRRLVPIAMLLVIGVSLAACENHSTTQEQRHDAIESRRDVFERAQSKWPAPTNLSNFPQREALVEFTKRQDLVNHPWYIYLKNMLGEYTEYYVGKTYPISNCNFLSSTEDVDSSSNGKVVLTAPSYDGMFYGGAGSSAACNSLFFFDYTTNAMVTFSNPFWTAYDQPIDCGCKRRGPGAEASPEAGS